MRDSGAYTKFDFIIMGVSALVYYYLFNKSVGMAIFAIFIICFKYITYIFSRKQIFNFFKVLFFFWIVILIFFEEMIMPRFSILFLLTPPLLLFITMPYIKKPEIKETKTLIEKIKQDLNIDYVVSKTVEFPKYLNWIGGFVSPLFPFISILNKNWIKKEQNNLYDIEAKIHEHVHIHLLLNKGYLFFGVIYILLISLISGIIISTFSKIIGQVSLIISLALLMVFFEKKTFELTKKYGKTLGVVTRTFTKKKAIDYFIYYILFFILIRVVVILITFLIDLIKSFVII